MIYLVLYSPSSVQRIIDFIKTVYAFEKSIPVIIKPIGAAAQIGIPEAYKYAYRIGKPLIILSELTDLIEIIKVNELYYVSSRGRKISIQELVDKNNIAIIILGGENEPSKKELEKTHIVFFENIPTELPPSPLAALILYNMSSNHKHTM